MSEIPIMVMPWHRPDPCKPSKMQTEAAFKATYLDYLSALRLDSPPLSTALTRIACTIGPSSNNVDMLVDLMEQGMSIALVPLSLGVRQDHINMITNLRTANIALNQIKNRVVPLGIAVQTKGPGLRIGGLVKDVPVELPLHHKVTLTTDKIWRTKGTEHYIYIGFPDLCYTLKAGDVLLVGNGVVILQIELIDQNEAVCKVVGAGVVHSYMSVAVPDVPLRLSPLTDEDEDDLRLVATMGVDIVVATHTQNATHVKNVRRILAEANNSGNGVKVWAQLETKEALDNLESIVEVADAIVLSRVSLTQDLPADKLFLAQKLVLGTCNKVGIPVFVTSHFLPSMQAEVTPSVSELMDVSCTVLDGVDGFILRNTTAVGKHPDHTVKTLRAVCLEAEAAVWHSQTFEYLSSHVPPPIDPTHAVAISAVEASLKSRSAAILLATTSGHSARLVARYRPRCPIIAVSRYGQVSRQLNTWRAIIPLHYVDPPLPDWTREVDVRLQFAIEFGKQQGMIKPGDPIVLMNGWRQGAGFTNTIRIVYASDSFPWVYPHRLPPDIPSDQSISEMERRLSPPTLVVGTSALSKPKFEVSPITLSHLTAPRSSIPGKKSLEEIYQNVHATVSADIEEHSLEIRGVKKGFR
ncbi:pyruvate kinase-like [Homalodisca vitripennis]|uniref:pyruvate kinase-like n=1 Tax=Homalodisca vitripennis TaxID=197043 RepID=UPI001EE9C6BF|nr:pyruvate kinase-like [Homalodisca vitripennis]